MTGEMIPDPDAGNEEEWDEEANLSEIQPVTIKLGQLNKSKHGSTQVCVLIFAVDHSGFKVHFFKHKVIWFFKDFFFLTFDFWYLKMMGDFLEKYRSKMQMQLYSFLSARF